MGNAEAVRRRSGGGQEAVRRQPERSREHLVMRSSWDAGASDSSEAGVAGVDATPAPAVGCISAARAAAALVTVPPAADAAGGAAAEARPRRLPAGRGAARAGTAEARRRGDGGVAAALPTAALETTPCMKGGKRGDWGAEEAAEAAVGGPSKLACARGGVLGGAAARA